MTPPSPPRLRFDKRKKAWVESPKSWLQELNERTDDFHAGLIFGMGVGGLLSVVISGLALLL